MKISAQLPQDSNISEIKHLVIESDESDTLGFYLFMHQSLEEPCEADLWFANVEDAKKQAELSFGVGFDDWKQEF
jgi:hypothetical protein